MKFKRDDLVYVKHMLDSIRSIYIFIKDISFEEFKENDLVLSAVIRKLEIIGEASGKISEELKIKSSNIEWRILKDFRNYLIHQYFGIDVITVWEALQDDIPELEKNLLIVEKELIATRGKEDK